MMFLVILTKCQPLAIVPLGSGSHFRLANGITFPGDFPPIQQTGVFESGVEFLDHSCLPVMSCFSKELQALNDCTNGWWKNVMCN